MHQQSGPWPPSLALPADYTGICPHDPRPLQSRTPIYYMDILFHRYLDEALPHIKGDECMLSLGIEDSVMVVLESIQRPSPRVTGDRGF